MAVPDCWQEQVDNQVQLLADRRSILLVAAPPDGEIRVAGNKLLERVHYLAPLRDR